MSPTAGPPSFDPGEDARLVDRCLTGDASAWAALVARHERLVYGVARSYRLSEADLGDVFQEVFAALVRGMPRIREARTLVRWLSSTTERIARATALRRRREQALEAPDQVAAGEVAADQPGVEAELETLEQQALVRLALESLPEGCRRLLTELYYVDPAPEYAVLARRLGMPIGSIGPTRSRCLERLRRRLTTLRETPGGIIKPAAPTSEIGGPPSGLGDPEDARPRNAEKHG
jgi:RNA polymerase sigma factor (sigma-70 family)